MEGKFTRTNPLRYNIDLRLKSFDRSIQSKIKNRVQRKMRVSESTVYRWIHCRQNDSADIPGVALLYFATCLNTTIEDLFNEQKD